MAMETTTNATAINNELLVSAGMQKQNNLIEERRKQLIQWHTAEEVAQAILWKHKECTVVASTVISEQNDNSAYKAAAEEFIHMMYCSYGLDVEFCNQKTVFDRGYGKQPLELIDKPAGKKVFRFHCKKCRIMKNHFSLIAWGNCVQNSEGHRGIKIQKMFFHDILCCHQLNQHNLPEGHHPNPIQRIVEIDYDNVFGESYDCLWKKLEEYDASKKEHNEPPGEHINLGKPNLPKTDNRTYQILPCPNKYPGLSHEVHKGCMIRLLYHMAASLSISDEVAPYIYDLDGSLDKDGKFNGNKGCRDKRNPNCHLYFSEVSLLFGGHHLRTEKWGDELAHQLCHMDGETGEGTTINENPDLFGRTKPGSFILPIKNYRSLYMWCVQNVIWVLRGQYVFFSGNVAHGGTTRKMILGSEDGREWHAALHGHLDSIYHGRDQAHLNREQKFRLYFPAVHWPFVPRSVVMDHFQERAKEIAMLIQYLIESSTGYLSCERSVFDVLRNNICERIGESWTNLFTQSTSSGSLAIPVAENQSQTVDDIITNTQSTKRKRHYPNYFRPR
jgi:hypothetical protein